MEYADKMAEDKENKLMAVNYYPAMAINCYSAIYKENSSG